jgi:hypothetical protein
MSNILTLFRASPAPPPFSLEATLASWQDPPRFLGKKKKDPPVASWLSSVASGCEERKVPRKHWPTVAKALMGEKALARVAEFERVLAKMEGKEIKEGEEYEWTWERFEVAVGSMGCELPFFSLSL